MSRQTKAARGDAGSSIIWMLRGLVAAPEGPVDDSKACAGIVAQDIGDVEIGWAYRASGGQNLCVPARASVARVSALMLLSGQAVLADDKGRRAELEAGDLCLLRSQRALEIAFSGPFELALVDVAEADVAGRSPLWRAAMMQPIAGKMGAPAVLVDAIRSLRRWHDTLGPSSNEGIAAALIDLVGAVVCFAIPANADCVHRSHYHRERIKRFVTDNLRNPDLTVDCIAEAINLSPRQVHRLFAKETMSLMRWVWVQRLENCYRELRANASANQSISEIAYRWGFNDQAHFSRAFRRHFGFPPRAARHQAPAIG